MDQAAHPVRVILSDNECMFRACLRQLLTAPPAVLREVYGVDVGLGFEVVGEAGSVEETVAVVRSAQPDLLLLDLSMPQTSGLDALRELEAFRSKLRTIVLAAVIDRGFLLSAVELGAHGVLMKDSPTELLFEAIASVMAGECWVGRTLVSDLMDALRSLIRTPAAARPRALTTREHQIFTMVVAGYPNREIAHACNVSEETVKHHLTRIFEKVGATNRVELAMKGTRGGLLAHS